MPYGVFKNPAWPVDEPVWLHARARTLSYSLPALHPPPVLRLHAFNKMDAWPMDEPTWLHKGACLFPHKGACLFPRKTQLCTHPPFLRLHACNKMDAWPMDEPLWLHAWPMDKPVWLHAKKNNTKRDRQTYRYTDIATLWKNRPRADSLKNCH